LAVATADYASRNRFNRLLRQVQQQQQQQQQGRRGTLNQGTLNQFSDQEWDQDDDDDDDDNNIYQQQQQSQCQRGQCQGGQQWNLDNDEDTIYGNQQQQNLGQDEHDYQQHGQFGGRQQNRQQQQQNHNCKAKFQLLQDLEQTNTQLASKLYKQAKQENDDKNTVVSPTAIQLALAAVQRGARGQTKRQIQRVVGAGLNQQQNQQAHAALQQSLRGQDPFQQQQTGQQQQAQIKTTTTIIINQRNRAQQQFIQSVKVCSNAQVLKCNFQRQPQQCRQQINQYIAQKTNQKLRHTVPQDAVTQNTKMIVASTTQIKANWGRQFRNQQQTKQGRFYPLGSQQPKQVQILQSQGQFNYYEDEQVQVVGVPTQNQELTFYAIVPKNKDGLNQVEKQQIQNGQQLKQLLENADQQQEQVDIQLPKFQIKHKIDAKQTLQQEGVQNVFDADEADLSGITGQQQQQQQQQQGRRRRQQQQQQNDEYDWQYQTDDEQQQQGQGQQIHLNKLIHQATIKINEQGITAAGPGQQGQGQGQQQQYQNQNEDEDDEEDEYNEGQQLYQQQQGRRQQLYEDIFGQRQQHQQQQRRQQYGGQYQQKVKANRAFAFAIKHNASNQIVLVGRVVDATQKPTQQQQTGGGQQQGQQSLNGVDQQ